MDTTSSKSNNLKNGLTFGLIVGLIYCISLFIRYQMINSNPIMIGVVVLLFYLIVIGTLVFCGLKRKKELGGFIEMKDAFQTIFIAVLVGELVYIIFNFIYLKYVDPNYFNKFMTSIQNWVENSSMAEAQKDKILDRMKDQTGKLKD